MSDIKDYLYSGKRDFVIDSESTSETHLCEAKQDALARIDANISEITLLQEKLYAEKKEGVVFVFQAMDAAGKDGTIRVVFGPLSTHGVREVGFKTPSKTDLAHDFLWRIVKELPEKGEIVIFNRSHYEDVLIGKVHELYKGQAHADRISEKDVIKNRYKDINNFEKYLYNNSIRVVKIFLNVSAAEQAKRFISRMDEPDKNWKVSAGDMAECDYLDEYRKAFEDCINATATRQAPWYVVPADHKWYMRFAVSEIVLETLREMDPHFPEIDEATKAQFEAYKEKMQSRIPAKPAKEKAPAATEVAAEAVK